ncbi:hypothetical protein JZ751_009390, partial [Albula glossodonta]
MLKVSDARDHATSLLFSLALRRSAPFQTFSSGTDCGKGLRGKWLTSVKMDTFPARTMYPQGRHPTRPKCLFHHCFHRWYCRPPAMASLRHSASDRFT